MGFIRGLARPLLAGVFIAGGVDVLRRPEPRAKMAKPVIEAMTGSLEALPDDPVALVRANAFLHLTAGSMLLLGILPRLASLALAASLVPTTLGGHRFWEIDDPQARAMQRTHLLKNAAILGGLLVSALD